MKVSNILATKGVNVISVRPDQTLKEVAVMLAQYKIGALPVLDEAGKLVGIISERDIVREAARNDEALSKRASDVMTKNVITGTPHDDIKAVVNMMTDRRFRHLPILDQGKLAGIITIGDVVKATLNLYQGEIDTLQTQISEG